MRNRSTLIVVAIVAMLVIGSASANDSEELIRGIATQQEKLGQRLNLQIERQLQRKIELALEIPHKGEFLADRARQHATSPASNR